MEGILSEEELVRFPVRTIRATSKPSPYRSQSSGITARGAEPGGVMVRGHEGPWRVSSTHVVLRAGLLQIQGSCQWRPKNTLVLQVLMNLFWTSEPSRTLPLEETMERI